MDTAAGCYTGSLGAHKGSAAYAPDIPSAPVRRILLIEDSKVLSRRLVELLCEPGRLTVAAQAATQEEALGRLAEGVYDVMVVDIELARGNGVAVIRQARLQYPPDGQPLIVVLTNYASDFIREHCFAAGADYFLDKMRDISLLKSVVADARSRWWQGLGGPRLAGG